MNQARMIKDHKRLLVRLIEEPSFLEYLLMMSFIETVRSRQSVCRYE